MASNKVLEMPVQSGQVRRVTGSADIPLNADGHAQAKEMASKLSEPFDMVFTSPEKRAIQTAKEFGDPIELDGLDAWKRGEYEGQPADKLKGEMRKLILFPNTRPPGKSPISGEEGETVNEFLKPLAKEVKSILDHIDEGERILLVTSGGNLQAIDCLLKAGFPQDLKPVLAEMAKTPYWSATGKLFLLTPKGLKQVSDNKETGVFAAEHGASDFNPLQPNQPLTEVGEKS